MGVQATVVFADLTDSTAFFEALGNEKATTAIMRLTQWIGEVCEAHHGRVVKKLGDGVLAVFEQAIDAVDATIQMQRGHRERLEKWPEAIRMEIKSGVARGEVVEVDGDCFGDAVNVAARLSDLSGARQIWLTESAVDEIDDRLGLRFISLGPVVLRGKTEPIALYKVEWDDAVVSDFFTQQAMLAHAEPDPSARARIHLGHLDLAHDYAAGELPVHLGRADHAEVIVNDPRVSRLHARVEWRNGSFVLVDLSSFGTWIRFTGSETDVPLRREDCVLHGSGEIALGVPLGDVSAPTVTFTVVTGHTLR
jgi:adenylate cyclase